MSACAQKEKQGLSICVTHLYLWNNYTISWENITIRLAGFRINLHKRALSSCCDKIEQVNECPPIFQGLWGQVLPSCSPRLIVAPCLALPGESVLNMNCWWWTQRAPLRKQNSGYLTVLLLPTEILIYKGNFIFSSFPDSFIIQQKKQFSDTIPSTAFESIHNYLKVLQVVIDFRTRPLLGVISLVVPAPFSLPTPVTALLVQGSITEDAFPDSWYLGCSLAASIQDVTGLLHWSDIAVHALIFSWFQGSGHGLSKWKGCSFCNHMLTSQVPAADLDSSPIITSLRTYSWILPDQFRLPYYTLS